MNNNNSLLAMFLKINKLDINTRHELPPPEKIVRLSATWLIVAPNL